MLLTILEQFYKLQKRFLTHINFVMKKLLFLEKVSKLRINHQSINQVVLVSSSSGSSSFVMTSK